MKSLKIQGYTLFELTTDKKLFEQATRYVFEHIESGALSPRIDKVFPLSSIVEAHRYMELNEQIGKIVISV